MMFFIVLNFACFNVDIFMGIAMHRMVLTMMVMGHGQPTNPWRVCQDFNR